jgi:hypothetical protein
MGSQFNAERRRIVLPAVRLGLVAADHARLSYRRTELDEEKDRR